MTAAQLSDDASGEKLARKSAGAVGIRATGAAFGFLFNVILARSLGREGTGTVMFYLNFASMLGLIATAGMDVVGLRELARVERDPAGTRSVVSRIFCNSLLAACVFSVGGFAFLFVFGPSLASVGGLITCAAAAAILFLTAFQKSFSDWLIALGEFATSQLVFYFLNRVVAIALLALAVFAFGPAVFSPQLFVCIYAAGLSLAVLFAGRRVFAQLSWGTTLSGLRPSGPFFREGIACATQNSAFIALNLSPFVLLGALSTTSQLGLFGVAQRLVALAIVALTVVSQFAMRDFARSWSELNLCQLCRTLTASVRLTVATAVPITIALVVPAPLWMSVFGGAFAMAAPVLVLLALGIGAQCLGMPFQSALLATNHEREARNVTLIAAAIGIVLNAVLIPRWGAEGAAAGTGVGLAIQSLGHGAYVLRLIPVRFALMRLELVFGRTAQ